MNRGGVDNTVNHKWCEKMRNEIPGVSLEGEILRGKRDSLAWQIGQGWNMVKVGLPLVL